MQRARSSFKTTKLNNLTRSKVISDKRNVIEVEVDEEEKDDVVGALLIEKDVWIVEEVRYVYFVGEYNVKDKLLFFVLEHHLSNVIHFHLQSPTWFQHWSW